MSRKNEKYCQKCRTFVYVSSEWGKIGCPECGFQESLDNDGVGSIPDYISEWSYLVEDDEVRLKNKGKHNYNIGGL